MVIGSGPIVIGQAAEFDYAGAQACRMLKKEGVNVVLINPNPATIMTDRSLGDEIYLEPLTAETVKRIILKEKPDSLLAGLGGQTGLTLASKLAHEGFLQKHNVRLIGTNAEAIEKAEDRKLFKETMEEIGEPVIPSHIANTSDEALEAADRIGYPVIIRPAFTLGGAGGGIAYNETELDTVATTGLNASPINQILVEKYIYGWKEIEFETMRDNAGNAIAVCSMENFDPVGIHTGDSIVAAPALTLSDKELQMLRSASMNIISALNIVGGCNCQFALDPHSQKYAVIEVNPRVSRSSALASKATGYPIAKVTTLIALGYNLDEITNDITGKTCACFEPALDYVVVKFPKWPFDKFSGASRKLGTQMKATGEVMAIAHSFEAALMKAIRGAEIKLDTLNAPAESLISVEDRLHIANDKRLFTVFEALKSGITVEVIHKITKIDPWFINKLKKLADFETELGSGLSAELYEKGKHLGYTDAALERISGEKIAVHRDAVYKKVDTCAAEFNAETPYFYSSYDKVCESRTFKKSGKPVIMVLGSGPIRIGQGIEFDYSSVRCVKTLKESGYEVVIVNNNPETVSTDYDTADRLYFEPLCPEDVMNVIKAENPIGVVVAFGGQTAINLVQYLDKHGIPILGTSAEGIDIAENRERFDLLLEKFGISRPAGTCVHTVEDALSAAAVLGYPVLLRPSYVIGGSNMRIVHNDAECSDYMQKILAANDDSTVLMDKYMQGTELEVDVISDGHDILIPGIMEHIERAGVHSGDSIAVYPPYNLNDIMTERIVEVSEKLAFSLGTKGLVNIQYLIYENRLYVIEVNPRASRTVPYISKATGVPMVDIASRVMLGEKLKTLGFGTGLHETPPYFAVKVPVFSFEKLTDANSYLGPEMKSTGEVLGIGKTMEEALFKGLTSAGMSVHTGKKGMHGVFLSVDTHDMTDALSLAKKLSDLGFAIFATDETADAVSNLGIDVEKVKGIRENDHAFELLESGWIDFIVYTGAFKDSTVSDYIALHRRALQLSIPCFTSLDTAGALAELISSGYNELNTELVDICHMRSERQKLSFIKMQATGDDYIFIENFDGALTCPESLCIQLCERHRGIGGYGIVLMEKSTVADFRLRIFNRDGSESGMAGNSIRCAAKYLFDSGIVTKTDMTAETAGGIKKLHLLTRSGKVSLVTVEMGKAIFTPEHIPVALKGNSIIDRPIEIDDGKYRINCISLGNPHCVVFADKIESIDIERIGPLFENAPIFPERTNTEFVRVVNRNILKMRVYERGNGETNACGTGACAAVAAAIENGLCSANETVTVKTRGGDLLVKYTYDNIFLTGNAEMIFTGTTEF